jgi:hypothetical protein
MTEDEIREGLEAMRIQMQATVQLQSRLQDQDAEKDRPLTPHFIESVARDPDMAQVRSLTELCGLRITMDTYSTPMGPLQCKRC